MRPDDVLELLRQQPFQPFRILVSEGAVFEVRHPELVRVGRSKIHIYFPTVDRPEVFETYEAIALLHITRLQPLEAPSTPAAP